MKKDEVMVCETNRPETAGPNSDYNDASTKVRQYVEEVPLDLEIIGREDLIRAVAADTKARRFENQSVEQRCVNHLRHSASDYDEIILALNSPDRLSLTGVARHALHVERRACVARLKERILDEIAANYPWLKVECDRQKHREGVEDDPGALILPFGPFKGHALCDLESDYLLRLLGQSFIRKAYRTRIERVLAMRQLAGCRN